MEHVSAGCLTQTHPAFVVSIPPKKVSRIQSLSVFPRFLLVLPLSTIVVNPKVPYYKLFAEI